jgi:hypothetical protein
MRNLHRSIRRFGLHSPLVLFGCAVLVMAGLPLAGCRSGSPYAESGSESRDAAGVVHVSKMGGDIDVEDAPNGADLSTMGGSIRLKDDSSFAKVNTMGGNIDIEKAGGPVDATTMGGTIRILAAADSVHAKTMGGSLNIRLIPSQVKGRKIDLTTMGGGVELIVPKGFPMDIDVEVAYAQGAGHKPVITEPFGLAHSETSDWDLSHGSPRKFISAKGKVGTGENQVVINGIGGDVTIVQE